MVVNDLDDEACHAVADEQLDAVPAPGDCSSEAGVRAIVGLREQPKHLFEITSLDQSQLLRFEPNDSAS